MSNKDRNEYMRRYMKEQYHNRRRWLKSLLGSDCNGCGLKDPEFYHFDHIEPKSKLFHLGQKLKGLSKEKLAAEIPKLQILCVPCHDAKTKVENTGRPSPYKLKDEDVHGRAAGYNRLKCRCELCRGWKRRTRRNKMPGSSTVEQ